MCKQYVDATRTLLHLIVLLLEIWLMMFHWYSYNHMMRKRAIIVLVWSWRPRTDGGLDVGCLAIVIIAVPDVQISGGFVWGDGCWKCSVQGAWAAQDWWQGAGQHWAHWAVHVKLIREMTSNLSVVLDSLLRSTQSVKLCTYCLTFPMLEQMQRKLSVNYKRIS